MKKLVFITSLVFLITVCNIPRAIAADPPYPPSPVIESITWDFGSLIRLAPGSDLWPTTWAANDNIYASWGDGGGFGGNNSDGRTSLGFARIEGPPNSFAAYNVWGGKNPENVATFGGKCAGMVSVDSILYAWINTQNSSTPDLKLASSSDFGATWQLSAWSFTSDTFAPSTMLNFGKDYADARDEYIYSYGGQWGNTEEVYMARVPKTQITDKNAYEYFAGLDGDGNATWTADIWQRQPIFTDPSGQDFNMSLKTSVVYIAGLGRYILTASHGGPGRLGIFDAPEAWGPWTTVAYYENWGQFGTSGEALLYSFPTKWMSADGKILWCTFSATGVLDSFNLVKATLTLKPSDMPPEAPTGLEIIDVQ